MSSVTRFLNCSCQYGFFFAKVAVSGVLRRSNGAVKIKYLSKLAVQLPLEKFNTRHIGYGGGFV